MRCHKNTKFTTFIVIFYYFYNQKYQEKCEVWVQEKDDRYIYVFIWLLFYAAISLVHVRLPPALWQEVSNKR